GNQFPECSFDFGLKQVLAAYDVRKERSTTMPQEIQNFFGALAQAACFRRISCRMMWSHPVRLFAYKKCDGGNAGRDHTPLAGCGIFKGCGMRRQSPPAHCACQAKLIEPCRLVIRDPTRQYLAFPGVGRNFESLKLTDDIQR